MAARAKRKNQGGRAAAVDPETGFRRRRDGFTGEKRRIFLDALKSFGTFTDAARVAGVSLPTVRRHEERDGDFASLCRAAKAQAASPIETLAWERGVTGIDEDVIQYGKKVGTRRKRSDSVFRMILMASDPEKYGHMGAVLRARIEKELRPKIEAEIRAELAGAGGGDARPGGELRKEIDAVLSQINKRFGGEG